MMVRRIAGAARGLDIHEMVERQIDYLSKTYPELDGHRDDVRTILDIELDRYGRSRGRMAKVAARIRDQQRSPTIPELLTLYESDGITPDYLKEAGAIPEVPAEFYPRLSELHQQARQARQTAPDLEGIPGTEPLYYQDDPGRFEAEVVRAADNMVIPGQDPPSTRAGAARSRTPG